MLKSVLAGVIALMFASVAQAQLSTSIEVLGNVVKIARDGKELQLIVRGASSTAESFKSATAATRLAASLAQNDTLVQGLLSEVAGPTPTTIPIKSSSIDPLIEILQGNPRAAMQMAVTSRTARNAVAGPTPSKSLLTEIDNMASRWPHNISAMRGLFRSEIVAFSQHPELEVAKLEVVGMTPHENGMLLDFGNGDGHVVPLQPSPAGDRAFDFTQLASVTPFTQAQTKAIVLSESPYHSEEHTSNIDKFCFEAGRAFPHLRIYRDPLSLDMIRRGQQLNEFVATPINTTALVAEPSFQIQDHRLIQNIRIELKQSGIAIENVEKFPDGPSRVQGPGALIIVSGHTSEELARFVDGCGKAGYFEGNLVLFNSCGAALTTELIHRINRQYKAVATFGYEGKIKVADLEDLLLELARQLAADSELPFEQMLRIQLQDQLRLGKWMFWGCWHVLLQLPKKHPGGVRYA